jgi:hypothetical protein
MRAAMPRCGYNVCWKLIQFFSKFLVISQEIPLKTAA